MNVGDALVDEAFLKMVDWWDGKDADTRIFRVHDSGGLTVGIHQVWDEFETLAYERGWTDSDENWFAERAEILDDLRDMDHDDFFVFHGHSAGYLNEDSRDPRDIESIVGLTGYDTAGFRDLISTGELARFMAEEGPGVVIISGCGGYTDPLKQTFVDKGTRLYIGWSHKVKLIDGAGTAISILIRNLLQGMEIEEALRQAHNVPALQELNQERMDIGWEPVQLKPYVADGNLSQNVYQLLGVEQPGDD